MSAPLVVNTRDGVCWTRRLVTSSGIALYAPEGVCRCPEFVMATLPELAEHGIAGSADVLPVPVGPESQASEVARERERVELLTGLRRALVPFCADPDAAAAAAAEVRHYEAEWLLGDAQRRQDRVAELEAGLPVMQKALFKALDRVTELEAERRSTNEALDDAVQALRERQAEREALVERMRAGQRWERGRNPELVSENHVSQSELREIFGIPLSAPWEGGDPLTRLLAPTQALREDPHESPLHHGYRVSRDLPETGGGR